MSYFSLDASKIFSLSLVFSSVIKLSLGMDFSDLFCWWFVKFLESVGFCLMPFFFLKKLVYSRRKAPAEKPEDRVYKEQTTAFCHFWAIISSNSFSALHSFSSGYLMTWMLDLLFLFHRFMKLCSFFFYIYNFFCLCYPDWIISVVLFSGSLSFPHSSSFHFIWSL